MKMPRPLEAPDRLRVSVVGTGYLGTTHAVSMAQLGHDVVAMDIEQEKIAMLSECELPFFEPGLAELLRKCVEVGRLRFTSSYDDVSEADIHFVCVGTPQLHGSFNADLRLVETAFTELARRVTRPTIIVGKSTVPAGTALRMADAVRDLAGGGQVEVAWNPEFLREGHAVEDALQPDRLIFGVKSPRAERLLRAVYRPIIEGGCPVMVTDYATAELVKVSANTFLAMKISFINAMAQICEATGAAVLPLAEALGYDDRIGRRFLSPGLGFGGGCLPKDVRALYACATDLGLDDVATFIRQIDVINLSRRDRALTLGRELLGGSYARKRVCVLGAAFKPNTDDVRDSPALAVAVAAHREGAQVVMHDPVAMNSARRIHPEIEYADTVVTAAREVDLVMLLTDWTDFEEMDPALLSGVVRSRNVLDGRNVLTPERWRSAGWTYRA
ncbi:UDP-glucose dehydrogenase family protein [Nonomuraea aurantiaca]|uniref:UDP-glucose dehydrogenase family protein n=1 Tax=Nonomuraea aurantiaca TaxID=2878562 RepID=UPI001CD9E165|nr:UDP-glucose/GDP-mannose dehydrogenase family protein [Nonomuraea aurantiaca]MCA2223137.1 UDP-glucose/GDP-mannose dehydrogenase family protein [Nonomuraea aurantiaca]